MNSSSRVGYLSGAPRAAKQAALAKAGKGLQIVDEIVTVQDLLTLATSVAGELAYLSLVSVWNRNDYIHAAIARGAAARGPLRESTKLQTSPMFTRSHGLARALVGVDEAWRRAWGRPLPSASMAIAWHYA